MQRGLRRSTELWWNNTQSLAKFERAPVGMKCEALLQKLIFQLRIAWTRLKFTSTPSTLIQIVESEIGS